MCTTDKNEIIESDCCGNGCANCILDSKPLSSRYTKPDLSNKSNVLHSYRKYKLIRKINNQPELIQLRFSLADKEQLMDFILDCPPGHHLMMRAPDTHAADNLDNKHLLRPYSPFWTDVTGFEFEILVNTKPNGRMTQFIQNLRVGDEVEFRGPIGVFLHEPSTKAGRVLMTFSHGVAIAPTIPIVESILDDEDDMTRIYHYSCFQDVDNIIFREKLMEFRKFWNFTSKVYLSRQVCTACGVADCEHFRSKLRYKDQIYPQRLEMQDICKELQAFASAEKEIVICGSKTFQEFISDCLSKCNVNKENIFLLYDADCLTKFIYMLVGYLSFVALP